MSKEKQSKDHGWQTISSKVAYKNPWLQIREDEIIKPDGTKGFYGVIETQGPSVFIIPLTDNNEIYLINQYRYPTNTYSWEIPAGSSDHEDLLMAAKRELQEETGLTAKKWQQIATMQSLGGLCSELSYIFLAEDLTQTEKNEQAAEGITDVQAIPIPDVLNMIKDGSITDAQTIAGISQTMLALNK